MKKPTKNEIKGIIKKLKKITVQSEKLTPILHDVDFNMINKLFKESYYGIYPQPDELIYGKSKLDKIKKTKLGKLII